MAHILIIDDEESLRFTFSSFLERAGYTVATADAVEAGLAAFDARRPDVVFTDIVLPDGRTGIELLTEVRRRDPMCPVIMVTGQPEIDTAAAAVRQGAFDYVPKPVRRETLLRLAASALKVVTLEREKRRIQSEKDRYRLNLEAIFRSVRDVLLTIAPDFTVTAANTALKPLCGLDPEAVVSVSLDHFDAPCLKACAPLLRETLNTREPVTDHQIEYQSTQGFPQVALVSTAVLSAPDDDFMGALLVLRDITRENQLAAQLGERHHHRGIVGRSAAMQRVFNLIDSLALTDSTVLVTGPSGTGKELVADAIHAASARADGPLVKVNCSALSGELLESELFGHVRGAFTGAHQDRQGRFAMADGGTIFLDEIGDMPMPLQAKLLRVLQEKTFERVGDSRTRTADVRIIAATNRNLKAMIAAGSFREDLYYRLKILPIALPPLMARLEDIPLLVEHFRNQFNRQFGKSMVSVSPDVMKAFTAYGWPGNVRELRHAVEHAFIVSQTPMITLTDIPPEITGATGTTAAAGGNSDTSREAVVAALRLAGGNKAKAARLLGVSRMTLYRKIAAYGIDAASHDV